MPESSDSIPSRASMDTSLERRAMWSGSLTFGLVSVPVALFPGIRNTRGSLRMLAPDGVPLKRRYYCPKDNQPVTRDEIVRGAEIGNGRYVTVTDEELESLSPEKSREIDLRLFVPVEQIDPFRLERVYFLAPTGDSVKPYRLLAETMEKTARAGIATFVMRGKEYLVAILAENGIIRAETLRFNDEIRTPADVGLSPSGETSEGTVNVMIENMRKGSEDGFDVKELKDETEEKLNKLIDRKKSSGNVIYYTPEDSDEEQDDQGAEIIDLMQILKRIVEESPETTSVEKTGRNENKGRR